MKIQMMSGLHADAAPIKNITIVPGVDVVVVADNTYEDAALNRSAAACEAMSPLSEPRA